MEVCVIWGPERVVAIRDYPGSAYGNRGVQRAIEVYTVDHTRATMNDIAELIVTLLS